MVVAVVEVPVKEEVVGGLISSGRKKDETFWLTRPVLKRPPPLAPIGDWCHGPYLESIDSSSF